MNHQSKSRTASLKQTKSHLHLHVHEGKKQFQINIIDCTFVGELPQGSYRIDGDSTLKKLDSFPKSDILKERLKYSNTKLEYKYLYLEEISSYTRNEIARIS